MNFIEELKWRGLLKDLTLGTEQLLAKGSVTGYIGFDPTAPSLTVGNLVTLMLLVHFQRAGHKPITLVGGATGMIGDPSGKDQERKLLDMDTLKNNEQNIKKQLSKLLDAEIVNNNDWYKNINLLTFLRDAGKYLTVNYLLSKGFIKERLKVATATTRQDISFTEFNYILMQAYDFLWLLEHKNCLLQMGGSDQWGNITAGIELIRKKLRKNAFGLTCPLLTKSDGSKFGKSEAGNIWLDPQLTSPYEFYQFWLNSSDEDAARYIRIFTLLSKKEIEQLEQEHSKAPHLRKLQKTLAKDVTIRIHSKPACDTAVIASEILFGQATKQTLMSVSEQDFLQIFEGVPQVKIAKSGLQNEVNIVDFLTTMTNIFPSKGEVKRIIQGGGLGVNKEKIQSPDTMVASKDLLNNKYILIQKGKKSYYLVSLNS